MSRLSLRHETRETRLLTATLVVSILALFILALVVENVAPPQGDALRAAVERGALPVLVIFCAAVARAGELGKWMRRFPHLAISTPRVRRESEEMTPVTAYWFGF